jgi:hypothetical protein
MNKHYYLLVLSLLLGIFYSCKKSDNYGNKSSQYSALIAGKWLAYQQHTQVFSLSDNVLVKDTLINFAPSNAFQGWFETYNTDGSGYVTSKPYSHAGVINADTTAYLHYSISGSHLTIKPNGGGSETDPIVNLTATDMTLEKTNNHTPNTNWGLDDNTTYKFVQDSYYARQ